MKSKEPINHPNNTPPSWCNMSCSYYPTCRKDHEAACDTVKALSKNRSKKSANDVLPDDIFLSLLNTAVQEKCEAKEVSDYILASNELLLAVETPGTELHIITNELDNYDKTVLASMAISANILGLRQVEGDVYCPATNGVKYIYYCPSECVESFSKFKVRIANFARRDPSSRREVDGWLRRNFSRRNRLMKKLMQLNGKSPEDFVNTLFRVDDIHLKNELVGYCANSSLFVDGSFIIKKGIENWLQGSEKDAALRSAKELNDFLCEILAKAQKENIIIYKRDVTIEYLSHCICSLYSLSEWQLGRIALTDNEREKLFQFVFDDVAHDDFDWDGIKEQFENWLSPNDNNFCAELSVPKEIIQTAIDKNLVFIEVDSDIPLSYSWCFFISPNGNQNAIAWYVTAEKNTNGSLSSDNTVFMYKTSDLSEMQQYTKGYATLINHNQKIQDTLRGIKSLILNYIGEDV